MPKQRTYGRRAPRHTGAHSGSRAAVISKLIIMLAVVAAIVLGVAIFFQVHQVQVQGNSIYSAKQIQDICGVEEGDNLLMVNRAAVIGKIYANLPYIQQVSVGRVLPDTIVIRVQESRVAGLVKGEVGSDWYVNTQGRVLGSSVDGFDGHVVNLTGFTIASPVAGEDAVPSEGMEENLVSALAVLEQLEGTGLLEQVTDINTDKSYDIKLNCGEQYEILLGGSDEMDYKIWYLQEVLEQLEDYQTGIIDLTLDTERAARFIPWE